MISAIGQASETAFCEDFCFLEETASLPVTRRTPGFADRLRKKPTRGIQSESKCFFRI